MLITFFYIFGLVLQVYSLYYIVSISPVMNTVQCYCLCKKQLLFRVGHFGNLMKTSKPDLVTVVVCSPSSLSSSQSKRHGTGPSMSMEEM